MDACQAAFPVVLRTKAGWRRRLGRACLPEFMPVPGVDGEPRGPGGRSDTRPQLRSPRVGGLERVVLFFRAALECLTR